MAKAQKSSTQHSSPGTFSEKLTIVISPLPAHKRGQFDDSFMIEIDEKRSTWPESTVSAVKRKIFHAIQTSFDEKPYSFTAPVWLVIQSESHEIPESLVSAVADIALGGPTEITLADDRVYVFLISDPKQLDNLRVQPEVIQNPEFARAIQAGKNAPRLGFVQAAESLTQLSRSVERGIDRLSGATILQQILCSLADCGDSGTLEQKRHFTHQIGEIRKALRASLIFESKTGIREAISLAISEQSKAGLYRCRAIGGNKGNRSGTKAFPPLELLLHSSVDHADATPESSSLGNTLSALRVPASSHPASEQDIRIMAEQLAEQVTQLMGTIASSQFSDATKRKIGQAVKATIRAALSSTRSSV